MSDIRQARKMLASRILEGEAKASPSERRAAFNNCGLAKPADALVDKVAKHAYRVTDEDIAAARDSGLSEDQVFEIQYASPAALFGGKQRGQLADAVGF